MGQQNPSYPRTSIRYKVNKKIAQILVDYDKDYLYSVKNQKNLPIRLIIYSQ